jgi:hypothetical protein
MLHFSRAAVRNSERATQIERDKENIMKIGTGLLAQLERCGLSAKLAEQHAEVSEDARDSRLTRIEIARAYAAKDEAQVLNAHAALGWLTAQPGEVVSVGTPLDLIDEETGEVLVSGRPGAVLATPDLILVVSWLVEVCYQPDPIEPDDDLGLLAMGLAACGGRPFQVAHVALKNGDVFPRRSRVFDPAEHPSLLARIKSAASRPRIACPGSWCGSCRQRVYCGAWIARAQAALTVFVDGGEPTSLEITNENSGALATRIKDVEKASELAKEQLKAFVRHGGRCVVDGKEYYLGQREGRKTVDVKALEADGIAEKYVKQGEPFEMPGWRKVR